VVDAIGLHDLADAEFDVPGGLIRLGVQVDHDALLAGACGRVGLAPLARLVGVFGRLGGGQDGGEAGEDQEGTHGEV